MEFILDSFLRSTLEFIEVFLSLPELRASEVMHCGVGGLIMAFCAEARRRWSKSPILRKFVRGLALMAQSLVLYAFYELVRPLYVLATVADQALAKGARFEASEGVGE